MNMNIFTLIKMINDHSLLVRMCEIGCLVMRRQIQVLFRHFNSTSVTVNILFFGQIVCTIGLRLFICVTLSSHVVWSCCLVMLPPPPREGGALPYLKIVGTSALLIPVFDIF